MSEIPFGNISSNVACELVATKSALETFLSGNIHRSSGIATLFWVWFQLKAIQKGRRQINHEIIQSTNKVAAAGRSYTLQWIPAQVNIYGHEKADELDKESRFCFQSSNITTLVLANAVASNNNFKFSIPALNCNRTLTSIIIRLRTKYVREMKISADRQRSYSRNCPYCSDFLLKIKSH